MMESFFPLSSLHNNAGFGSFFPSKIMCYKMQLDLGIEKSLDFHHLCGLWKIHKLYSF